MIPTTFWDRVSPEPMSGCWLWTGGQNRQGYGQVKVRGRQVPAHRVVLGLEDTSSPCVLHKCDVPSCVNPSHLFLGTHKDNSVDMVKKGRSTRGERNSHAKLTEDQVHAIRTTYAQGGITQAALSRQYGVTDVMISYIVNGKNWRG